MDYSRIYTDIHEANPKKWAGSTIKRWVPAISGLVSKYQPKTLIDYGCGKGYQYLNHRIHEQWGGILPHCYDVGVRQLAKKPEGMFDGALCTDVLEHVEEEDAESTIAEVCAYVLKGFVFFSISCKPCRDIVLPDGRNGHINQKPPSWWLAILRKYNTDDRSVYAVFDVEEPAA